MNLMLLGTMLLVAISSTTTVYADAALPWQVNFQDPATPIASAIIDLHHKIFFFLIIVAIFVGWMLFRILFHFSASKNKIPSKVNHGSLIEVIWTITPSFILLFIALPSFDILYAMDEVIDPAVTIKAIGHQWYWSYEYSDYNSLDDESLAFDSYMVPEEDLEEGQLRLLEVDERVVVPTNTHIRFIITAADVLHCWAVPSLGVKMDAVPGRLNQTATFIQREGIYYGQCSEICGVNHGYMPIAVEAVSLDDYLSWVSNKIEIAEEVIQAI
jgi:cytochrome c oxidase subunit 2